MQETNQGSVRVDLVGGTLDIDPINLILPNVVTLNVATSLKAEVKVSAQKMDGIKIISEDYNKTYSFDSKQLAKLNYTPTEFEEMTFIIQLLDFLDLKNGICISLKSGAPAGSGLGGSSAMGITLFKALCSYKKINLPPEKMIKIVKGIESRILSQGVTGYQDYYPAVYGGILALKARPEDIVIEQLYSEDLKSFLEKNITLVYSGLSRNSGINNWQVYKRFFDGDKKTKDALSSIAEISYKTYTMIKEKKYNEVLSLIGKEGEMRKDLAPDIVPQQVEALYQNLSEKKLVSGMKMCGAGGGGCFILTHQENMRSQIIKEIDKSSFKVLDFIIEPPHEI